MIRVFITSVSPVARAGVEALLRASPNIEVVSGSEDADVVIGAGDLGGEDLPRDLLDLAPFVAVLIIAGDGQHVRTAEALRSGMRGVLPRDATPNQIIAAIEAAAAGLAVLPAEDVETALAPLRPARNPERLSPREMDVLARMAEGQSNKLIAYGLSISEHTVKFHVNSILTKLNAGSRTEAVTLGIRQGMILL